MGDSQSKEFGNDYVGQLQGQLDKKAPVFGKSLFVGAGDATKNAWNQGTSFASGLNASGGLTDPMRSAMGSFEDIGAGYGAVGANGGLTSAQSGAMSGLSGLGGQFAGLGGLTSGQQGNLNTTNNVGTGFGALTQNGGLSAAQSAAMGKTGGLADAYGGLSSAYDQNAPGYERMRQQLLDDAVTNVGAGFTQSGRFGGGSYINDATEASLNAIAPLDYQNYQNNVNNQYRSLDSQKGIYDTLFGQGQQGVANTVTGLQGQLGAAGQSFGMGQQGRDNSMGALSAQQGVFGDLFGMGQQGQSNQLASLAGQQGAASSLFGAGQQGITNQQGAIDALGQIGAAQDANAQGKRLGNADLFDRTKNAELDRLLKIGSGFGGAASSAANEAPWWQQLLGGALGLGGSALSGGAFGG